MAIRMTANWVLACDGLRSSYPTINAVTFRNSARNPAVETAKD
jgi:hypothetical protein